MEDLLIIKLFWERNEKAIEELRNKYGALCFSFSNRILRRKEDAEECVNSAYFSVWKHVPPDKPNNLRNYLLRIVRNISLDRLRYNTADKRSIELNVSLDELSECLPNRGSIDEEISEKELGAAISFFLREQKELDRVLFVRRYWHGESVSQIAQSFDINEKTAATKLFRTRKKLRYYLEREGLFDE